MNRPPENSEDFLGSWRGALPGHEVRTIWSEEHGCWICLHRLQGETEIAEMLPVEDREDQDRAMLHELRSLNICAPLIASGLDQCNGAPRVFVDGDYWSSWHPCDRCGGFAWRLQLPVGMFGETEIGQELEREFARMLAHRAVFLHGTERPADDCVGCVERSVQNGEVEDEFAWFSSKNQQWHLRVRVDGDVCADLPLGLCSWASREELRSEIKRVRSLGGPGPYNWEEDGL